MEPVLDPNALELLVDPVSASQFQAEHYQKQPCVVLRNQPDRYAHLVTLRDLDGLLGGNGLKPPDINLVRQGKTIQSREYAPEGGPADPLQVARHFGEGATVIFTQLHRRLPRLAEVCAAVSRVLSCRTQTNIYLTPRGNQGFAPHWDSHDVFVLQVLGHKTWKIYSGGVDLPLRGQVFDPDVDTPPALTATHEFTLGPGDAVYVPRGVLHSAVAEGGSSLHVTLGLLTFTWAEVITEAVAAAALEDPDLREGLPLGFASAEFPRERRQALFEDKILRAVDGIRKLDAFVPFEMDLQTSNGHLVTNALEAIHVASAAGSAARLRLRPGIVPKLLGDRRALSFQGKVVEFPEHAWPAAEWMARTASFSASEMPGDLDEEGQRVLLKRLVVEGLLEPEFP